MVIQRPILTAEAINAGTYEIFNECREQQNMLNRYYNVEKGGWIELKWEESPGTFSRRSIQVSRERALQAMTKLAEGAKFV